MAFLIRVSRLISQYLPVPKYNPHNHHTSDDFLKNLPLADMRVRAGARGGWGMGQAGGYVLALHHAGLRSRQISLSWRLPLPESSRRVSWNVHFRADDSSSENSASPGIRARNMHAKGQVRHCEKLMFCKLAEAHGNRTHLGTPSRPHTGFEVREPHQ